MSDTRQARIRVTMQDGSVVERDLFECVGLGWLLDQMTEGNDWAALVNDKRQRLIIELIPPTDRRKGGDRRKSS